MLLWGSSFPAMKVAVQELHPLFVVFARMTVAGAVFSLFLPSFRRISLRRWWPLLVAMGIFEPGLYFLFEGYALRLTSASQAGMITATLPLMVAVTARFYLKEELGARRVGGLLLAVMGVAGISWFSVATDASPNPVLGNILETAAMLCAAGYMVLVKRLSAFFKPLFLTAAQTWVGFFFFLPFLLVPGVIDLSRASLAGWVAVLYLGIVVTFGAYGLYNFGISRVRASTASAFVNLIPVFSGVLGWAFLGEVITWPQLGFAGLVFAGVALTTRSERGAKTASTPQEGQAEEKGEGRGGEERLHGDDCGHAFVVAAELSGENKR